MNLWRWLTNKSYRKGLWAHRHLTRTRILKQAGIDYHARFGGVGRRLLMKKEEQKENKEPR
ncbi:hypothetical protein ES703_62879 [subsurface metagenome]